MRPKQPETEPQEDLFRARLANLVDRRHALVRLAGLIDWGRFETEFGPLYTDGIGRPGLPTRLMVRLHLLKHMDGLSDEAACARYLDSPYAQLFCGEAYFQHASPLDRSSMTRWRRRIGAERLEVLLAEGLATAERGGAVEEKHFRRVTIDTTVQPKAVTHPTDSKLLHRGIEILARLARRHGVRLRQAFLRVAKRAKREVARLMHSGRARQAERRVRQLRTWLGRLRRDIGRKIAGDAAAEAAFAGPLALIARLLHQRREDRGGDKLYSLHAPEVECIGKGKAHARFEFGVKVSIATTNAVAPGGQFVLGARALPGNPYDGHTLADQIAQAELYRPRFLGHRVEPYAARAALRGAGRGWKPLVPGRGGWSEPVPLDQPGGVVGLAELEQRHAQVLDGVEGPHPQQVLLQGADEAFGAAVAFRRAGEAAEVAAHALANRLQRLEAGGALGGVEPNALGRAVIDGDEDGDLALAGDRGGQVGAPHDVHGVRDDGAIVGARATRRAAARGASRPCARISRSTRRRELRMPPWRSPAQMGWTAPNGSDAPRCGSSRPAAGAAHHERYHDRPGYRQVRVPAPRHRRERQDAAEAQAAAERADPPLRAAAALRRGHGGVRRGAPLGPGAE